MAGKKASLGPYEHRSASAKALADKLRSDVEMLDASDKIKARALEGIDFLEQTIFRVPGLLATASPAPPSRATKAKSKAKLSWFQPYPKISRSSLLGDKTRARSSSNQPIVFSWIFEKAADNKSYNGDIRFEWIFPLPQEGEPRLRFQLNGGVFPTETSMKGKSVLWWLDAFLADPSNEAVWHLIPTLEQAMPGLISTRFLDKAREGQEKVAYLNEARRKRAESRSKKSRSN